jgi:hypothetical protein
VYHEQPDEEQEHQHAFKRLKRRHRAQTCAAGAIVDGGRFVVRRVDVGRVDVRRIGVRWIDVRWIAHKSFYIHLDAPELKQRLRVIVRDARQLSYTDSDGYHINGRNRTQAQTR